MLVLSILTDNHVDLRMHLAGANHPRVCLLVLPLPVLFITLALSSLEHLLPPVKFTVNVREATLSGPALWRQVLELLWQSTEKGEKNISEPMEVQGLPLRIQSSL